MRRLVFRTLHYVSVFVTFVMWFSAMYFMMSVGVRALDVILNNLGMSLDLSLLRFLLAFGIVVFLGRYGEFSSPYKDRF